MTTQVKVKCVSKKSSQHYDGKSISTDIELEVPYDPTSIYYKMSGGTNLVLKTVNQDAADMFSIGSEYMVSIEPVVPVVSADDDGGPVSGPPPNPKPPKGN